jgi:hypothetical protein
MCFKSVPTDISRKISIKCIYTHIEHMEFLAAWGRFEAGGIGRHAGRQQD